MNSLINIEITIGIYIIINSIVKNNINFLIKNKNIFFITNKCDLDAD